MHTLKSAEGFGWELKIDKNPEKCTKCREKLTIPCFFCPKTETFYCEKCEKPAGNRCNNRKIEHIHYNIISIER